MTTASWSAPGTSSPSVPTKPISARATTSIPRALDQLFAWDEAEFLRRTEGSPIRRSGHERWLRNIAVALGNAPSSAEALAALQTRIDDPSPLVREHVQWALGQHTVR